MNVRVLPWVIASLVVAGFIMTLNRAPRVWSDEVLYASIARSIEHDGSGVPSMLEGSEALVDHQRFYGPLYFQLAAASFRLFGFSIASFRVVSLLGTLLVALAGATMVRAFGGGADRQGWAFTLLVLTPELGTAATNGRMDGLAVGLALLGLAMVVRGLLRGGSWTSGCMAGLLLAGAALTTPRALPLVASFAAAGVMAFAIARAGSSTRRLIASTLLTVVTIICAWLMLVQGGPVGWMRDLSAIALGTPVDVGFAPQATRDWSATPWTVITPFVAAAGFMATIGRVWPRRHSMDSGPASASAFLLAATGINAVLCLAVFNLTFGFSIYFAVPVLAVVLAVPESPVAVTHVWSLTTQRRAAVIVTATFILCCVGIRTVKYAALAATWAAKDPAKLEQFVSSHVPPGSEVWGPHDFGFYAVEGAGSSFRSVQQVSAAEWTLAVPVAARAAATRSAPRSDRYLLWPVLQPLPASYSCSIREPALAVYNPPSDRLELLGPIADLTGERGYPASALFRVPASCP